MKTIYKADPLKDYTRMHNSIAQSTTLSLAAKGMLLYLLSLPENWQIVASQVEKACGIGKQARRSIFSELESACHMKLVTVSGKGGRMEGRAWIVFASVEDFESYESDPEVPLDRRAGKPTVGEAATTNKYIEKENNVQSTPKPPRGIGGEEQQTNESLHSQKKETVGIEPPEKNAAHPPQPPELDPLHEWFILLFQKYIRSPYRDAAEVRAFEKIKDRVTEEDKVLLQAFYAAEKRKDTHDETWNRKTAPTQLMNQLTTQLEYAERYFQRYPEKDPRTATQDKSFDYDEFCKLMDGWEGMDASQFPDRWKENPNSIYPEMLSEYEIRRQA